MYIACHRIIKKKKIFMNISICVALTCRCVKLPNIVCITNDTLHNTIVI